MNYILIMSVLCFWLLAGCAKKEERKSPPALPMMEQAVRPEQPQTPDYEGLIEEYRTILAEDPDNLAALIALGNAYYDSGQWQKAIIIYDHALLVDPRNADVRTDMGTAYRNLGMCDRALAEYRLALQHEPAHLNARYNMGIVYAFDKKDFRSAIHVWEEILKIAPNYPHDEYIKSSIAAFRQELKKEGR